MAELKDLIGKTLTIVEKVGEDKIVFTTNEGRQYKLYHHQECCESVTVEDIVGELSDLVGEPILIAEEATSTQNPQGVTKEYQDSFTWTFYKFAASRCPPPSGCSKSAPGRRTWGWMKTSGTSRPLIRHGVRWANLRHNAVVSGAVGIQSTES